MCSGTEELNHLPRISRVHGTVSLTGMACLRSIQTYTIALCTVSTLVSLAYLEHMFPPIIHLLISFMQNMKKLWKKNFKKDDTSVLSQKKNWKPLLDHSSPLPSLLFPNQENQGNTARSMTSPTRVNPPQTQFLLSIPPSAHTTSPAHRELFPQSASLFTDCHLDPKPPLGMLQKLIKLFQYAMISGQVWSYASVKMTALQQTYATTSASPRQVESMDSLQTPEQTFSEQTELVQYLNGSMTTSFSESDDATFTRTTTSAIHGAKSLTPTVGEYTKEVAYGTEVTPCPTDAQKSLTRTWPLPCVTSPLSQHALQMTLSSHTLTSTSTTSQKHWAYPGKYPRAFPLDPWSPTRFRLGP